MSAPEPVDAVARYAQSLGFVIRPRTVLVEGTTDVRLFELAARLERTHLEVDLLGQELAIVAAGERDLGGTRGVLRELICFRGFARTTLLPDGRQVYRFVGLFDNDKAGRAAVKAARDFDTSILEFKDTFRLAPVMPRPINRDPGALQKAFESANAPYKGIDWEIEDALSDSVWAAFLDENPSALIKEYKADDKVHRELTRDGKARLHRFVQINGMREDLGAVIDTLRSIRHYLGLPLGLPLGQQASGRGSTE